MLTQRLLDYTWRFLVPKLHEKGFSEPDSGFVAGLAHLYAPLTKDDLPPEEITRLLRITEQAVKRGTAPPSHLGGLLPAREQPERQAEGKTRWAVGALGWGTACFEGSSPLAFAQQLLNNWKSEWWTPGNLARLRILLCDRAFESGFEIRTLLDAGQTAPALGAVLKTDAPQVLAALRLLWSLRPTRPWDRLGVNVLTAFELAADPDHGSELIDHADVILWQQVPGCLVVAGGGGTGLTVATIRLDAVGGVAAGRGVPRPAARVRGAAVGHGCDMEPGAARLPLADRSRSAVETIGEVVPLQFPRVPAADRSRADVATA